MKLYYYILNYIMPHQVISINDEDTRKKYVLGNLLDSPRLLDRTNFSEDPIYFLLRSLELHRKKERMS